MAYDAATGTVVLFGGYTYNGHPLGDTWIWDGTTWTLQTPAVHPTARSGAPMAYIFVPEAKFVDSYVVLVARCADQFRRTVQTPRRSEHEAEAGACGPGSQSREVLSFTGGDVADDPLRGLAGRPGCELTFSDAFTGRAEAGRLVVEVRGEEGGANSPPPGRGKQLGHCVHERALMVVVIVDHADLIVEG
jgi:hypothetical protein